MHELLRRPPSPSWPTKDPAASSRGPLRRPPQVALAKRDEATAAQGGTTDPAEHEANEIGARIGEDLGGLPVSPGKLSPEVQARAEHHVGVNLAGTELSDAAGAHATTAREGAYAVTEGSQVSFAPGRLTTSTAFGRGLLGHELTHVAQQRQAGVVGVQRFPPPGGSQQPVSPPAPTQQPAPAPTQQPGAAQPSASGQPAAAPTPQSDFQAALPGVSGTPGFPYLQKAVVGGTAVVANAKITSPTTNVVMIFNLTLSWTQPPANAAPKNAAGSFEPQSLLPQKAPGNPPTITVPFAMTMHIVPPAASVPNRIDAISSRLVHEGTHLALFIESSIASLTGQPATGAASVGLAQYVKDAHAHAQWGALTSGLQAYLTTVVTNNHVALLAGTPAQSANAITSTLIEEKFSSDTQDKQFAGTGKMSPAMIQEYVEFNVNKETTVSANAFDPDLKKAITAAIAVLQGIPAGGGAGPAPRPQPKPAAPKTGP